jgi:N,N'-diacetylchitobiose phosphorylase
VIAPGDRPENGTIALPWTAEYSATDIRSSAVPPTQVLSNGRYTVIVTAAGTGYSSYDGLALTRWIPDRTHDALGSFVYVRDEETHDVWSAALAPVRREPDAYSARFGPGWAEIVRRDHDMEISTRICVAPDADVEVRLFTLTNRSDRARRISVTVYAEAVLNAPLADAGHPAFSKLFVQTQRTADGDGIIATRRLRSAADEPLHVVTRLIGPGDHATEIETDRARFIGRGKSLAMPRALIDGEILSGTTGNVLDPVLSIRRYEALEPGESAELCWLIGAGAEQGSVDAEVRDFARHAATRVPSAFTGARQRALELLGEAIQSPHVHVALGAQVYGTGEERPRERCADGPESDRDLLDEVAEQGFNPEHEKPVELVARRTWFAPTQPPDTGLARRTTAQDLRFFNGHGGFSLDGSEYVILPEPARDGLRLPPLPWTNVIANERVGFIASERGTGFTWCANSRLNRLTPWSNDPVMDPQCEALYVRDDLTGAVWSPTPGPVPGAGHYEVRHGLGYTTYTHEANALLEETISFVPRNDPVKLTRVRITNTGDVERHLSLVSYAQWVLGAVPWDTAASVTTRVGDDNVIRASNAAESDFTSLVAFAAVAPSDPAPVVSFTTDRRAFLGAYGATDAPSALGEDIPLDGRADGAGDPCAALRISIVVGAGETLQCTFMLGEAADDCEVDTLVERYRAAGQVDAALAEVRTFWQDLVGGVQISTPSPAIDLMVNAWLTYQNLSCRIWGRSAFYQSGGAFGFRDQLQDAAALIHVAPERTREQILLHAAHQFVAGDVLHWWHPPSSVGIRTHFSDDLLWLPYITAYYIEATGDESILDEMIPFVAGPELSADEDEVLVRPELGIAPATLYDHCCHSLDRSLTAGAHGLPLMGTGDWNDGMNRVGREGRGESVWLGFFLAHILDRFTPLCERRDDPARSAMYWAYRARLGAALNDGGWDGAWYRRAYYDDGTPLGTAAGDECRIDAIAQAWAVISGVAPPERAADAMNALEEYLVSEPEGIIRLLTPPFDRTPRDPGYIKGYIPGVRENGGQYTHGVLWAVRALAELGRCDRAAPLLEMLSPVLHGGSAERIATYKAEPYVIAADVYGVAPHVGRAGWTWYTGSAGWMYRVALESVLGIELLGGDSLIVRPCVPKSWQRFSVRYRLPDRATVYDIRVERGHGETRATLDGAAAGIAVTDGVTRISLTPDGRTHQVRIALGSSTRPRYYDREISG